MDWREAFPITVVILMLGSMAPMISDDSSKTSTVSFPAVSPGALAGFNGGGEVVAGWFVNIVAEVLKE